MKQGSLVYVDFNPVVGHEQKGARPALVLSQTEIAVHQRYPLIIVAPLTSTLVLGPLYPTLAPTKRTGLSNASRVLLDQLRAIDKRRILRILGEIEKAEQKLVTAGLRMLLGI